MDDLSVATANLYSAIGTPLMQLNILGGVGLIFSFFVVLAMWFLLGDNFIPAAGLAFVGFMVCSIIFDGIYPGAAGAFIGFLVFILG